MFETLLALSDGAALVGPLESIFGDYREVGPMVAIGIPLVGAFVIAALGRWPNLRETATVITALQTLSQNPPPVSLENSAATPIDPMV